MSEDAKAKQAEEVTKQSQELILKYTENARKMMELSRIHARQFMGMRNENDPRLRYLIELDSMMNMLQSQVEVLTTLVTTQLGVDKLDYLKCAEQVMANSLKRMQDSLGITGWDEAGSPLFDLAKYKEVTSLWPK